MTRLALVVVVWFPFAVLLADEPKKPATELEGAWVEPGLPGEDASLRYKITFNDDKITLHHREQVLTGTFEIDSDPKGIRITLRITNVKGNGSHTSGTYFGIYEVEKNRVSLQITPPRRVRIIELQEPPKTDGTLPRVLRVEVPDDPLQRLAPVTLTLHKVKK